jgi:hypothetical protein
MPHLAALLLLALAPLPVDLDSLSIDRARHLSPRVVSASFLSVKPADYRRDRLGRPWTVPGAAVRDDAEWGRSCGGRGMISTAAGGYGSWGCGG